MTASQRRWWVIALVSALAGVIFTSVQIVEKITILKNPGQILLCDVSPLVSCTNVLEAWQSSVLGPPNALVGAVMFAVFASAGLSGALGSRLARAYVLALWALAVFFLCFASWFMYQTAFTIGSLCLWCTGITTAVIVICAALTRLVVADGALGTGRIAKAFEFLVRAQLDLAIWVGWWFAIAGLVWVGLWL